MLKFLFYLLLLIFFGGVAYDLYNVGSFQRTTTFKYLQDSGAIDYGDMAFKTAKVKYLQTSEWAEKNIPVYYNETLTLIRPYTELTYQLFLILKNTIETITFRIMIFLGKNYPAFQQSVSILLSDVMILAKSSLTVITYQVQNYTQLAVQYANNILS